MRYSEGASFRPLSVILTFIIRRLQQALPFHFITRSQIASTNNNEQR